MDGDQIAKRATRAAGLPVADLVPLPGGLSSITLVGRMGSDRASPIVVKVAPPGLDPVRNRDVLRQARVLSALADVDGVAVPAVLFTDAEPPPLFGMAFVEGESVEPVTSTGPLPEPGVVEARAVGAARMLARLHAVDVESVGLGHEPAGGLVEEVDRWERALDTVDEDLRPGHHACAAALRSAVPEPVTPAILHGDWRLGNMLCQQGRVAAVIDWEIWSVGDPRIDLAWFLANTEFAGNPFALRPVPGMPDRSRLLAAYEDEHGASIGDLGWFEALTAFKETATMGLILKRNRRRPEPDAALESQAPLLPRLLDLVAAHAG